MQIFIQHQGRQTGPFPIEQVRAGVKSGLYQLSDLAWYEGARDWQPLSTIDGMPKTGPPPTTAPPRMAASHAGDFYQAGEIPRTPGLAIASLVLGILSFILLALTGIPAVICGHLALSRIKKSDGKESGGGLALAGLICGYIGIALMGVAMLAGLTAPLVIRQRKKADQAEAMNHARALSLALFEFKTEYGAFPNAATSLAVSEATETGLITGGPSANSRFRQLFHAGMLADEMIFHARAEGVHRPDNLMDGDQALESGECAFAYVSGGWPADGPPRPVAMAPVKAGTDRFDYNTFDGKAVVLWSDGSVKSLPIDRESGRVLVNGQSLLDPKNPVWNGGVPEISLPE